MKIKETVKILFPKPHNHPPAFPIVQVSKTVVVDKNGTAYDTWDHNGEVMYKAKFEVVIWNEYKY
jgi:hypothetical protein